ncbi:hypothetical protein GWI33_020275 [Rhynchophorus ferrugineus]|uniref:PIG-P domain-containing protein n=1 Tax=Rhynchophorus ferrugineus TaxID=354439 RepID=A0A834M630_RHYFE|nr:hypothetical protein GWI33_020275 [Rhynchophorus ferrugineus]
MAQNTPSPTPIRAVYGFIMFLSLNLLFIIYLIWSLVPGKYFEMVGLDFLPQRHWAISVPIFVLTATFVFGFVIYPSLGLLMTPHYDDLRTITDKNSYKNKENIVIKDSDNVDACICKDKAKCHKDNYKNSETNRKKPIPSIYDLNIWDVSEHLYLNK